MDILFDETLDMEHVADLTSGAVIRDLSKPHATDLIRAAKAMIHGNKPDSPAPEGIMAMGRIWEIAAQQVMDEYARENGGGFLYDVKMEKDGIICSLDGMLFLPEWTAVVEMKLKFQKAAKPWDKPDWLLQTKGYCAASGCQRVVFPILNLLSNPPRAIATLTGIEYSQLEIDETWQMLLNTKAYLEKQGGEN